MDMKPEHVEEAAGRVRGFLKVMAAEADFDQSDEVLGPELIDRWERLLVSAGVDHSTARSLLVGVGDALPQGWHEIGRELGWRWFALHIGAAVALVARQLADEEAG
jgi:hypothetical protein